MLIFRSIIWYLFLLAFFLFPLKIFAIDLTFSSPPNEIASDQEFTIDVTLSDVDEGKSYFIKGAFFRETGKYLGFTKNNNGVWKNWGEDFSQLFKITGNQTTPITFKPDASNSNFKGTGEYSFKLKRITEGGSETWHDQTATLTITQNESPTATVEPTLQPNVPSNISLSEIFAYPETGGKEWVELYNNNDQEATLTDWKIRDSTDSNSYQFSVTIPAKSWKVIELNSAFLNNTTEDSVKLVNQLNNIVDEMSYPNCDQEKSWVKHEGSWKQTSTITRESANSYTSLPTQAPNPTNTPKSSATPKPSATVKPTSTPKITATQQIIDESGELAVESTFSALETSPSGLVLGTEIEDSINLPSATESLDTQTTHENSPKSSAIGALILGGLIFTGIGSYLSWTWYQKHKH